MRKPKSASPRSATNRFRLSRRSFLTSATAASTTIWLPALDVMFNDSGTAYANNEPLARRFIEFFWGVSYSTVGGARTWAPRSGSGPLPATLPYYFNTDDRYQAKLRGLAMAGKDGLSLEHLTPSLGDADIRKYVRIIDGVSTRHLVVQANQHSHALVGVVTLARDSKAYTSGTPSGPSLDRFIGSYDRFRLGTKPHVHLAVCPVANYGGINLVSGEHRVSIDWTGLKNGQFNPGVAYRREQPHWDPLLAFEEMFGNTSQAGDSGETRRQRSVLDGVLRASQGTLARLGARDRSTVEAHLEGIRQLEKNLMDVGTGGACPRPEPPQSAQVRTGAVPFFSMDNSNRTAPRVAKDMRDIARLMIQCDYTRCMTFVVTPALSGFNAESFIDFSSATGPRNVKSLHRDSHDAKPYHRLMTPWHMGQLAAFIKAIASVPEGAGSAIDDTLIWATSEHGPQVHSLDNIATIVAGGPKLVGGNHFDALGQRPMADMHLGILQALELPLTEYQAYVKPKTPRPISLS